MRSRRRRCVADTYRPDHPGVSGGRGVARTIRAGSGVVQSFVQKSDWSSARACGRAQIHDESAAVPDVREGGTGWPRLPGFVQVECEAGSGNAAIGDDRRAGRRMRARGRPPDSVGWRPRAIRGRRNRGTSGPQPGRYPMTWGFGAESGSRGTGVYSPHAPPSAVYAGQRLGLGSTESAGRHRARKRTSAQAEHGPVEPRTISSGSSSISSPASVCPVICAFSSFTAASPIARTGWRTVVSGGSTATM